MQTWPVRVPHRMGGLGPVGLEITNTSSAQLPITPVPDEVAVVTNFSKSILSLQTSVLVGQMV